MGSIVDLEQVIRVTDDDPNCFNEETKFENSPLMENLNDFSDEVEDEIEFMRVDQMGESQFSESSDDDELEMFGSKMIAHKGTP